MKKLFLLACPLLLLATPLATPAQEAPKAEIFGGYSYLRTRPGEALGHFNMNGINTSVVGNVTENIGIVAEFSGFRKSETINLPNVINQPELVTVQAKTRASTFLVGPRLTLRSGRAEPFLHALVGGAHGSVEVSIAGFSQKSSGTTFAYALGGGIDVKVSDHFAVRFGQLDYLRGDVAGDGLNNFRYSVGIVIRMGKR